MHVWPTLLLGLYLHVIGNWASDKGLVVDLRSRESFCPSRVEVGIWARLCRVGLDVERLPETPLFDELPNADQSTQDGIEAQRGRVATLKGILEGCDDAKAKNLFEVADNLVKRSVWGFGGDGWAYDIGYGGLDHALAQDKNINLLVMDTEVYSNTGGQASKAIPLGAVAKFAAGGKELGKKDLGLISMTYGHIYVARIAMGANQSQVVKALLEAESWDGPSIVICYAHCIAHGIDMAKGLAEQKKAVESGAWVLYRYDPRRTLEGKNPLQLDSKPPKIAMADYMYGENRFRTLTRSKPAEAEQFLNQAQASADARWNLYSQLAGITVGSKED